MRFTAIIRATREISSKGEWNSRPTITVVFNANWSFLPEDNLNVEELEERIPSYYKDAAAKKKEELTEENYIKFLRQHASKSGETTEVIGNVYSMESAYAMAIDFRNRWKFPEGSSGHSQNNYNYGIDRNNLYMTVRFEERGDEQILYPAETR